MSEEWYHGISRAHDRRPLEYVKLLKGGEGAGAEAQRRCLAEARGVRGARRGGKGSSNFQGSSMHQLRLEKLYCKEDMHRIKVRLARAWQSLGDSFVGVSSLVSASCQEG